jgi:DUF1707 SHOCT-like domain
VSTVLVGDRDREQAAAALRRHFANGRLSLGELSERVELALRARTRADLNRALSDLPLSWEELPAIVHNAAHRLRRGVRRTKLAFVLVRVWSRLSLGLALVCGIALVAGVSLTTVLGAFLILWALASFGTWQAWRRAGSRT